MKIEFFIENYYCGGIDTFIINLVNNWPNNHDEMIVVCNKTHSGLPRIQREIYRPCIFINHTVRTFQGFFNRTGEISFADQAVKNILKITSPVTRYLFLIFNIVLLKKILIRNDPERLIIVNGGYPGGDACRAASIAWGISGKKTGAIHTIHGIAVRPGWHIALQEFIINKMVSYFTGHFVIVSKAVGRTLAQIKGIDKDKFKCIYNGVAFRNAPAGGTSRKELEIKHGIPRDSYLCLMMGGYHCHTYFDKGHNFLIKAFSRVLKQVPNAHLLICGYGSQRDIDRVRRFIFESSLEKNVHLDTFREDIPSLLELTDVLLISAQTFESFCLASIEAMAHKVPVVATDVGGIPEIVINGEGGYCVPKDDLESYAGHILHLLTDAHLKKSQGVKGFQRYTKYFTARRMSSEYARLLNT